MSENRRSATGRLVGLGMAVNLLLVSPLPMLGAADVGVASVTVEAPAVPPSEDSDPFGGGLEGEDLPTETEFDLNDPEVTQYAGHYGIDPERALEIARWMDLGGLYVDNIREMLAGNWAGNQMFHGGGRGGIMDDPSMEPGQLRLEIFLADSDASDVDDVLRGIPELDGLTIEVIDVPLSRVELDALAADLDVPDGMEIRYNIREGTVDIVQRTDHEIAVDMARMMDESELMP